MAKGKTNASPEQTGEANQITPEQVAQLQSDLAAANAVIQEKEELLSKANADMEAANTVLQEKELLLSKATADLESANTVISQLKIADKAEQVLEEKKPEVEKVPLLFSYNGKRYTFSRKCPEKINVDGTVYSQEELIKNKELMVSLIDGGNAFVKLV